jgi:hypothetical protein
MTHQPRKIVCNGNSVRPLLLVVAFSSPFRAVEVPPRTPLCCDRRTLAAVADLTLPTEMARRYTGLQARSYGTIDGHDVIVLTGRSSPDVTEALSVDRATGLLLRRVIRFTLSMGRLPTQIDYADYRAVGGVKMPFEVRVADWSTISAAKFTEIVLNPSLDEARFARPTTKTP